ncbi:hypothetical protein MASR1M36_20740 [Candidatus Cloacimonadaceae bacterium]
MHKNEVSLKGQLIVKRDLLSSDWVDNVFCQSLPDLPNGIYLLKLSNRKGNKITKKIVITQ